MVNEETKAKALGRLRRIEGQVQGLQRMIDGEAYCVDILLQISAVQGALEQVEKLLLGRHIESCVADAVRSGSKGERQQKIDELLDKTREVSSQAERKKLYSELIRILQDELPMLYTVHPIEPKAFSPRVQGYEPIPDGMMRFKDVWLK